MFRNLKCTLRGTDLGLYVSPMLLRSSSIRGSANGDPLKLQAIESCNVLQDSETCSDHPDGRLTQRP